MIYVNLIHVKNSNFEVLNKGVLNWVIFKNSEMTKPASILRFPRNVEKKLLLGKD